MYPLKGYNSQAFREMWAPFIRIRVQHNALVANGIYCANIFINVLSDIGIFATHAVLHLEPLFTKSKQQELFHKLNKINTIFATKLNHAPNMSAIRVNYFHPIGFYVYTVSVFIVCLFIRFNTKWISQ